jgi:hypothetical protein
VDNILFFPATSLRKEAKTLADVFVGGQSTPEGHQGVGGGSGGEGGAGQVNQREEKGMLPLFSTVADSSGAECTYTCKAFIKTISDSGCG